MSSIKLPKKRGTDIVAVYVRNPTEIPNSREVQSKSMDVIKPRAHCWFHETSKFSISSELLLRIHSIVLTSFIGSKEVSEFRRLVTDSIGGMADYFSEIMHKQDTELLIELFHFPGENRKSGYYIIHICTEMAQVGSVGSLALYVTILSRALQRK